MAGELRQEFLRAGILIAPRFAGFLHIEPSEDEMLFQDRLNFGCLDKLIESLAELSPRRPEQNEHRFVLLRGLRFRARQYLVCRWRSGAQQPCGEHQRDEPAHRHYFTGTFNRAAVSGMLDTLSRRRQ